MATTSSYSMTIPKSLTHYNALATGFNSLMPASYATGMNTFYGMPWEIFRTDKILWESRRPVTFATKAGGVPMYFSRITLLPEYGLGITILVAGDQSMLGKAQELVSNTLVQAAEEMIWRNIDARYSGTYTSTNISLNSTLTLTASEAKGLTMTSFISNSTDVFGTLLPYFDGVQEGPWHAQLVPTLLFKNETAQQGEIWRVLVVRERTGEGSVWDEFCSTNVDVQSYAGLPLNEIVFWHEKGVLELPAFRVKMKGVDGRGVTGGKEKGMVVQTLEGLLRLMEKTELHSKRQ